MFLGRKGCRTGSPLNDFSGKTQDQGNGKANKCPFKQPFIPPLLMRERRVRY
jgi:hypothetical protein